MKLSSSVIPDLKSSEVAQVVAGSTAVLNCTSNDFNHNFMFWLLNKHNDTNNVIGPGNAFDERKYKYEVLSGRLHINNVSPDESGYYFCVSRDIKGSQMSIGEVEMLVMGSPFSAIDAVKLVAILVSIIVIVGCAVIYNQLRKDWNKYDGRMVVPVDDPEEDEPESDDIYNRTTTAINPNTPMPGPSRNVSSDQLLYGIDNQGLDTDFNSVFENIQIKSTQPSLI